MKVFLDTNVILEYLMQREQVDAVERLMEVLQHSGYEKYMSSGGFYSILYVMDNYFRKYLEIKNPDRTLAIRTIGRQLLADFNVAEHDNNSLRDGVNNEMFVDLEDSCQYHAALKIWCKYFLTFNTKHYPSESGNGMKTLTPNDFVSMN